MSPVLLAHAIARRLRGRLIRRRLRGRWAPEQWVLVAYTRSPLWGPRLEGEVIPRLGDAAVVVDRSRPDWKARFPIEVRAIEHWGGDHAYNPLVLLVPEHGKVETLRFYDEFLAAKHGDPAPLDAKLDRLFELVSRGPSRGV